MRWLSRAVLTAGVVCLLAGLFAGFVNREVIDSHQFARHVDAVRADPDVSRELGGLISDRLIAQNPELIALRPLVESAATATVSSPAFGSTIRATVAPLQEALVSGNDDQFVLRLADVGALVSAALVARSPQAEASLPSGLDVRLAQIGGQEFTSDLVGLAHLSTTLAWLLPLIGILLVAAASAVVGGRSREIAAALGRALMYVAGAATAIILVGGIVVSTQDPSTLGGAVVRATWGELDGPAWRAIAIAFSAGLVLWITQRPASTFRLAHTPARIRDYLLEVPTTARGLLLRAAVLIALGICVVTRPLTLVAVATVALGLVVIVSGLDDLVSGLRALWDERRDRPPSAAVRARWRSVGAISTGVALLSAVVLIGAWPAATGQPAISVVDPDSTACNGHDELCDRTYDQVSFPSTHNSMAAGDEPGWFLSEQPTGIIGQLDAGIRVFLIDSWYGQKTQRPGIVANTVETRQAALDEAEEAYGPSVVQAAVRLRDSLRLTPTGEARPYLCHGPCELGSTEWEPEMERVRDWMTAHPREVVTFFVQDVVTPADTAAVFQDAGLMPFMHTQQPGKPWPTLGSMVDSGRRLVVLMENHGGGSTYPWMLAGKTWVQDTPFHYTSKSQFTCAPFRGAPTAPLFLVNHWLSNYQSRVADGAVVNAEGVLLPRLEQCQKERKLVPNFVSVNNFDQGDLFASVDAINGFVPGG